MRKVLVVCRQKRKDALFEVGFTKKTQAYVSEKKVSLLTEAKHFLVEAETIRRFRFF